MVGSRILLFVGLIALIGAVPFLWLQRTLLTTDGWVDATGPLAEEPAIQEAVADFTAVEFARQVDLRAWISEQLPEESQGLAAPLASLIVIAIRQVAEVVVGSDTFADLWRQINRTSHNLAQMGYPGLQALAESGRQGLTLNLTPVLERLREILQERGISIPVPEDFTGEVTILESAQIQGILTLVRTIETWTPWLTVFAVLGIVGSIAVAGDRRTSVLWLGVGLVAVGFVVMITAFVTQWWMVQQVPANATFGPDATRAAYDAFTNGLATTLRGVAFLGLILWLGAFVLGPAPSMQSARRHALSWIGNLGKDHSPNRPEAWIGAHRHAIQIGILILGGLALLLPIQRSIAYIGMLALTVLLLEFFVELFGRMRPRGA